MNMLAIINRFNCNYTIYLPVILKKKNTKYSTYFLKNIKSFNRTLLHNTNTFLIHWCGVFFFKCILK